MCSNILLIEFENSGKIIIPCFYGHWWFGSVFPENTEPNWTEYRIIPNRFGIRFGLPLNYNRTRIVWWCKCIFFRIRFYVCIVLLLCIFHNVLQGSISADYSFYASTILLWLLLLHILWNISYRSGIGDQVKNHNFSSIKISSRMFFSVKKLRINYL